MKLISCYIENFGGLSGYAVDFDPEITVLKEQNGFGKTTLAEFLRAMFYGFPRQSKTLDKNRRQKYMPWQGGSFGGNLTFEVGEHRYRMERTFGDAPKKDTFRLIDLQTGRECRDYSEEIGLELFRLDADSFERSTYLPQSHDITDLTTDGIQAKLGDLVEDTNDIGNFEKAMNTLRAGRSALKPYRGSGGSIAEATARISQLQTRLEQGRQQKDALSRAEASIAAREAELKKTRQELEALRQQIRTADQTRAQFEIQSRYASMLAEEESLRQEIGLLRQRYPKGIPTREAVESARKAELGRIMLLGQEVETQQDREAAALVEKQKERFRVIPTAEQLEGCREDCENYRTAAGQLQEKQNTHEKRMPLYLQSEQYKRSGLLEKERLEELSNSSLELHRKRAELQNTRLSQQESGELEILKRQFSGSVPEDGQLQTLRQKQADAARLRREAEDYRLQRASEKKPSGVLAITAMVLGVAAAVPGVVLLTQDRMIPGIVLLTVGLILLLTGGAMGVRQMVSREISRGAAGETALEKLRGAKALEQEISGIVSRYIPGPAGEQTLMQLEASVRRFRELSEKEARLSAGAERLRQETDRMEKELLEVLGEPDFDHAIAVLRTRALQYGQLQQERTLLETQIRELNLEQAQRDARIREVLCPYFPELYPREYSGKCTLLQQEIAGYQQALTRCRELEVRRQQRDSRIAGFEEELTAFSTRYELAPRTDWVMALRQIADDGSRLEQLEKQLQIQNEQAEAYFRENKEALARPVPEALPNVAALQDREQALQRTLDAGSRQLLEQKQDAALLRSQVDELPAIRDCLESWQQQKKDDQTRVKLLDDTMEFLQKSRDHLSCQYLGPVGEGFAAYMQELMGEQQSHILVNTDLQVSLERQGKTRSLDYFSAGQEDLVLLCMRFALVDALFTGEQPFVILDDPFVNLDDRALPQVLRMLRKLGKRKQILYLTCHSSRSL